MLRSWAIALQNSKVRGVLIAVGVLATIALAPVSVFGGCILLMSLFSDAPDRFHFLGWSVVGTGGVIGIVGAWVRVLLPGRRFQTSATLKWGTAAALAVGVAIAGLTFVGAARDPLNPVAGAMAIAIAIGVFLFGATIGEVRSNPPLNSDAREAGAR